MAYSHFLLLCKHLDAIEREHAVYSAIGWHRPQNLLDSQASRTEPAQVQVVNLKDMAQLRALEKEINGTKKKG